MEKQFDTWNENKKLMHSSFVRKVYSEREIWWCSIGLNIGYEEDGKGERSERPVVVVRGISKETCYVVPLSTSQIKHKYRLPVGVVGGRDAVALLSQMRLIDTKRLINKIGYLNKNSFEEIKKSLKDLL